MSSMRSTALLLMLLVFSVAVVSSMPLLSVRSSSSGSATEAVSGLYGEAIELPCTYHLQPGDALSWQYEKDDDQGTTTLMSKTEPTDETEPTEPKVYDERFGVSADGSGLRILRATLNEQGLYRLVIMAATGLQDALYRVSVYKKPSLPAVVDAAAFLEAGVLTPLGTCVARDGHPAAELSWRKDGRPLQDTMTTTTAEEVVKVTSSVTVDPSTGLSTASSSLEYRATRQDVGARFSCLSHHPLQGGAAAAESEPLTVPVHYPTESLRLTAGVIGGGRSIAEGDDVALRCLADGNPPPGRYDFHLKDGTVVRVEGSDTYTLAAVTRDAAGEYKCSLVDSDGGMEASLSIAVSGPRPGVVFVMMMCLLAALVAIVVLVSLWHCRARLISLAKNFRLPFSTDEN